MNRIKLIQKETVLEDSSFSREAKDRKQNPYYEAGKNNDIAEDDYSEESDADSVYMERD